MNTRSIWSIIEMDARYLLNCAFEDLAIEELKDQYETNLPGVTIVARTHL
jgi:hypothetical protein